MLAGKSRIFKQTGKPAGQINVLRTLDAIVPIPALVFAFCISALGNPLSFQDPIETTFNSAAGRGDNLLITVSSVDGNEWLFGVDTGSSETILDRSLEPMLGRAIGQKRLRYASLV